MASSDNGTTITGGCNCGALKYSYTFPADTKWPLDNNGICQCTLCRKFTGGILPQLISIPTKELKPSLKEQEHYKEWESPLKGKRGFCMICGCSITYTDPGQDKITEIYVGSIDEDILLGVKAGEEDTGVHGKKTTRKSGGPGPKLIPTGRSSSVWHENSIEGVTDGYQGIKFWRGRANGEGFSGSGKAEKTGDVPPVGMGVI